MYLISNLRFLSSYGTVVMMILILYVILVTHDSAFSNVHGK